MRHLIALLLAATTGYAAERFVATTGSDAAAGTIGAPFLTIQKGLAVSSAGDTVSIRGGTYNTNIDDTIHPMPSGTSWANPFTIQAYNGEAVILRIPSNAQDLHAVHHRFDSYVIYSGIYVDAQDGKYGFIFEDNSHHIRTTNCTIANVPRSHGWIWKAASSGGYEALNCTATNIAFNKQPTDNDLHGIYNQAPLGLVSNVTFIGSSGASWAIHNYGDERSQTNTYANIKVYGRWNGGAALFQAGSKHKLINLQAFDDGTNQFTGGVQVLSGDDIEIINSTIYNTGPIYIGPDAFRTIVDNNIVTGASLDPGIANFGQQTTIRNNLIYGNAGGGINFGSGSTSSGNLVGAGFDAAFTSTTWPFNFTLRTNSSALNAGRNTGYAYDYVGVVRPQGAAYDIGAYEKVSGDLPVVPTAGITTFSQYAYEEGSVDGTFTVHRDDTAGTLTVNYRVTGTAVNGTDYTTIATNIAFAAGQADTNIVINPTDDGTDEADKTIIIDLWPDAAYNLIGVTNATMTQIDNDVTVPPPPPPPPPIGDTNNTSGGGGPLPRRRASITFDTNSIVVAGLSSNDLAYSYNPTPAAIVYVDRYIVDTNRLVALEKTVAALRAEQATLRQQVARTDNLVLSLNYRQLDLHNDWTNTNAQLQLMRTALRIP